MGIPAVVWNAKREVLLQLWLPDAVSPKELGESEDGRQLALGSRRITFRTIPAENR